MKKFFFIGLLFFASRLFAGDWYDGLYIRDSGRNTTTASVTVSSSASTALLTQAFTYDNIDVFNNSAYTVWIGSNAATTTLSTIGFPLLSSSTYTLDGKFTDVIYGLADSAAGGSVNVRVIYYNHPRP